MTDSCSFDIFMGWAYARHWCGLFGKEAPSIVFSLSWYISFISIDITFNLAKKFSSCLLAGPGQGFDHSVSLSQASPFPTSGTASKGESAMEATENPWGWTLYARTDEGKPGIGHTPTSAASYRLSHGRWFGPRGQRM